MSNYHLQDATISFKAKGLLSFMLSLPETWSFSLAGIARVSLESIDAVRSGMKELETAGYVERSRVRNEHGQMKGTEYVIREIPENQEHKESVLEGDEFSDKSKASFAAPVPCTPTDTAPSMEIPAKAVTREINTNITSTNKKITYSKITENECTSKYTSTNFIPSIHQSIRGKMDGIGSVDESRRRICDQIEYKNLARNYKRDLPRIDELIEIMVEVEHTYAPFIHIGREREYQRELVIARMNMITSAHIERILESIRENTTKVKNPKAYLLAALFNSPVTIENDYTMQVNHDIQGFAE